MVKLAGNENRLGGSPLAKQAIIDALDDIAYYPDIDYSDLRLRLSQDLGILPDELIFGNGSFELLSLAAQACLNPGDEAILPSPSFNWYVVSTLATGAEVVEVPLKDHANDLTATAAAITEKTRLIWLCNPNNPTGAIYTAQQFDRFLEQIPDDILVVIDEAYYEYVDSDDYPDTLAALANHRNLIVLRTFSKVYGLAGLRIGYGVASQDVISLLNKIRLPINVNRLAQKAALASLDDVAFKEKVLKTNKQGKERYYAVLEELGLSYVPTQCNFILFETGIDSDIVVKFFLDQGFLIRGGREFGFPTWLRVTIGTEEDNESILSLLRELRAQYA